MNTLSIEPLEQRDTPAVLSGIDLVASVLPTFDYTGPLGGSIHSERQIQGNTLTQYVEVIAPNGETILNETAVVTLNVRTGTVEGTITIVGPTGQTSSGQISGRLVGNTFEETTMFTGPNGQSLTQHGVYVGAENSFSSNVRVTGPNGRTVSRVGMTTYDPDTQSLTLTGSITGPAGRSFDYTRTI